MSGEETKPPDSRGKHAQNVLAQSMKALVIEWDKDSRKREQLIKEVRALDQKIAGHEQVHRELSSAAAILDHLAYAIPGIDLLPTPDTAAEFDHHQPPTAVLARYRVRMEPVEGVNR